MAELVWSLNMERRQLTKSQRDAAGVEMEAFIEAEEEKARKRPGTGRPKKTRVSADTRVNGEKRKQDDTRRTTAKVAAKVKSSPAAISRAKAVKERAPDLFKQMKDGKVETNSAYNQLKQREKVRELEEKSKKAELELRGAQPSWTLVHGDVMDVLDGRLDDHDFARLIFCRVHPRGVRFPQSC